MNFGKCGEVVAGSICRRPLPADFLMEKEDSDVTCVCFVFLLCCHVPGLLGFSSSTSDRRNLLKDTDSLLVRHSDILTGPFTRDTAYHIRAGPFTWDFLLPP